MRLTNQKNGLVIGIVFTIVSLLLWAIPAARLPAVLPGLWLDMQLDRMIPEADAGQSIERMAFVLVESLLIVMALGLRGVRLAATNQGSVSALRIVVLMTVCYFIVHPLGLYIYWGLISQSAYGDAAATAAYSMPVSSFAFIGIGVLVDVIKNTALRRVKESAC